MLYVFQVDLGCMYTFELNLFLESISTLKNAITAKCNISVDNQVLLISGGDYLEDNFQVHQYVGAGTVSNPIFLFNKSLIMQPEQYSLNQQQITNINDQYIESTLKQLQIELEDTLKMDASLKTVIVRTDIAKKLNQTTCDLMSICEQLNKDQHLMYQGWSAVIANLDDVANSFSENVKNFEESLKLFLTKRDYYQEKLKNFENDMEILDQIKILSSLHEDCDIKQEEEPISADDRTVDDNSTKSINSEKENESKDGTLMNLINQKDNKHCLEKVTVYCNSMLEQFNEQLLDRVKEEMNSTIKTIDDNKKIKKIESRLFNLDMLLKDVGHHVQDQNLLTFGFIQNQNSANTYNDPTIFADLCNSHKTQLDLMFKHFNKAVSIKKKFQSSKRELTYSLLTRLNTIMICETELNSLNWRVLLYSESLKKLKRSLEVVDQINLAPSVYFKVFKEINRRNKFNFFFKIWSNFIVQTNRNLIETENEQRKQFRKTISSHFLKSFFPRFDDNVPEFACNLPEFDQSIPEIDETEFIEFIKKNKEFDKSLELEDNFLNGFIYKMKNINEKVSEKMTESLCNDNQQQIDNKSSLMNDEERLNLLKFADSLFPIKQKHPDQIEQIKNRLTEEYECKLNALKLEYKLKLDEELKNLTNDNQQDNLVDLNCQVCCSETANNLSSSCISNNIDQTNVDQLSRTNLSSTNDNPIDKSSSPIDHIKDQLPQKVLINYKENLFKNLINDLLSIKYTDYLKESNGNDFAGQPINLVSLVSTLINIAWPKNYLFA